jgi:hypothetical protein
MRKKENIDSAIFTQNRMIEFNENTKKRYIAFNYIIIVFIIAFVIVFIILLLARFFPFIPSTFMVSIILAIAIIVCFLKYYDVSSRWNMDYDVYNLNPPIIYSNTISDLTNNVNEPTDLSNNILKECVGSTCCSSDTVWDQVKNLCLPKPIVQSFKTMDANEFENYSKY